MSCLGPEVEIRWLRGRKGKASIGWRNTFQKNYASEAELHSGELVGQVLLAITHSQRKQEKKIMSREELLTEEEELNLKNALEHIEELEHLMKKRPVETFKSLLKLKIPMELEIEIEGGTYAVTFNDSD